MRGKQKAPDRASSRGRITPAHAGKTALQLLFRNGPADHPRACGENLSERLCQGPEGGSPPRMRGKRLCLLSLLRNPRITPAHAGKTHSTTGIQRFNTDHPRACGENKNSDFLHCHLSGSPPRMRGKLRHAKSRHGFRRITPAHAGKTRARSAWILTRTDHPRACGENA